MKISKVFLGCFLFTLSLTKSGILMEGERDILDTSSIDEKQDLMLELIESRNFLPYQITVGYKAPWHR